MLAVVLFVGCLVAYAGAVNLLQFVDNDAAVVFVLVAAVAVALAAVVLTSRACAAVSACLFVDPGPGSAVALVHVAE